MSKEKHVVVVGCSGAGASAALALKSLAPTTSVTILREHDEKGLLTRCATPYICCGNVMVDPSYKDDAIFLDKGIRLVNSRAETLNAKKRLVRTEAGDAFEYDTLVLATGAKPALPPIPGVDLPGVFTLRKSDDSIGILQWVNMERVRSAVLVGAGPIGVEIAYLAARHGIRITVVEMLDHVLPKALDADLAAMVEERMKQAGIDLRLGQRLDGIDGAEKVESVRLASGETLDAQLVLISTGVRPNAELAEQAGLQIGDLGIQVNSRLQTSNPDIYAAGDVIEFPHWVTGKTTTGQLRPNAVIAGRVVARNILGDTLDYPPLINSFATKFFDQSIAGTGLTEQQARAEGIDVVSAAQTSFSMHSMMHDKKPYIVKLVFEAENGCVIGGQIVSDVDGPMKQIDVITAAIRGGLSAADLATFRCAGQPELSPDPGKEPIAMAAAHAYDALAKTARQSRNEHAETGRPV